MNRDDSLFPRADLREDANYRRGDQHDLTMSDLWRILISQWRAASIAFSVILLAALAYAFLSTKIYRSEIVLVPASDDSSKSGLSSLAGQIGGLASIAGISVGASDMAKNEAVATLKAKSFTEDFVRDENLLPVLFAGSWDPEAKKWTVPEDEIPTMWDAFKKFDMTIRFVTDDAATGLVTLAIEWKNPKVAAEWATKLIKRLNEQMRKRAISQAQKSIDYLKTEQTATSVVGIQQALYSLIESQLKVITLANTQDEYAFRTIDPASVPDLDDFTRPRRLLIILLGIIGGIFLGIFVAFVKHGLKPAVTTEKLQHS